MHAFTSIFQQSEQRFVKCIHTVTEWSGVPAERIYFRSHRVTRLSLDKVCEIIDGGQQPLPLAGVRVRSRAGGLVGGFILHGGVALGQRDGVGGARLNFLLSLLMEKTFHPAYRHTTLWGYGFFHSNNISSNIFFTITFYQFINFIYCWIKVFISLKNMFLISKKVWPQMLNCSVCCHKIFIFK